MFAHRETDRFLAALDASVKDARLPHWKARGLKAFSRLLRRPLRFGIFGEPGSGQPSILNILLQYQVLATARSFEGHPATLVRYGETLASYSVGRDGSRHRLTSKVISQLADRNPYASGAHSRVIYQSRQTGPSLAARDVTRSSREPLQAPSEASFIEVFVPAPMLRDIEILEVPVNSTLREFVPEIGALIRRVDIAAWVTIATGAWKNSEFKAWKRLASTSQPHSILIVTDNEALAENEAVKLRARIEADAAASFRARAYVAIKRAALLQSEGHEGAASEDWEQTGFPFLLRLLHHLTDEVRAARLARVEAILNKFGWNAESVTDAQAPSRWEEDRDAAGVHSRGQV